MVGIIKLIPFVLMVVGAIAVPVGGNLSIVGCAGNNVLPEDIQIRSGLESAEDAQLMPRCGQKGCKSVPTFPDVAYEG